MPSRKVLIPIFFTILTSCNPIGQVRRSLLAPERAPEPVAQRTAANADGNCTREVLEDTSGLRKSAANLMIVLAERLPKLHAEDDKAENLKAIQNADEDVMRTADTYKQTYGRFQCKFIEDGELKTLDPELFYLAIDEVRHAVEMSTKSVKTASGECPANFATAYKQLANAIQPQLELLTAHLAMALKKVGTPETPQSDIAKIREIAKVTESLLTAFRSQHAGEYSCYIADADGTKIIINSEEMDAQIERLKNKNFSSAR